MNLPDYLSNNINYMQYNGSYICHISETLLKLSTARPGAYDLFNPNQNISEYVRAARPGHRPGLGPARRIRAGPGRRP